MEAGLVPQSGRGFMRSDAGDAYSSNEWVFVDLRAERALELEGDSAQQAALFAWNVDQASDNFGELSELHDPVTADYAGQAPMVGFGAGAYLLSLFDRGAAAVPTCGSFASEPASPSDAGVAAHDGGTMADASAAGSGDGGRPSDDGGVAGGQDGSTSGGAAGVGKSTGGSGGSGGCGCTLAEHASRASGLALLAPLLLLGLRRRPR
jgi:hypothetical protein